MIELLSERWATIAVAGLSVTAVAVAGGLLTEIGPWYEGLNFPPWRPPNWLFGPTWTLIFVLTAASGVIVWHAAPDAQTRYGLAALFALNGVLNVCWSLFFFKLRRPDWALIELVFFWLSIFALIILIAHSSATAAWLIAPYLAWVTFAGYLNWRMIVLNRPFVTNWGARAERTDERRHG